MYLVSGLSFFNDRGVLRTVSKICDETKDSRKDNFLKNFTVLPHCLFAEVQLALKEKFLVLIELSECKFIQLLTRLYLIP